MAAPLEEQRDNNGKLPGGITGKGFMPGQSGNPGGRPKGSRSLTALLREALERDTVNGKPIEGGRTAAELIVDAMIAHALDGKFPYAKEIWDRIEGKVPSAGPEDAQDNVKAYEGFDPEAV